MIKNIFFVCCFLVFLGCSNKKKSVQLDKFDAHAFFTKEQQDSFVYTFIRYAGKMHKKANDSSRFNAFFDDYYLDLAHKHELVYLVPDYNDGYTYFCLFRIAPSLVVKKVALAGRLKLSSNGSIEYYEEIYRTWKMLPDELEKKNDLLFSMLLKGEDLSPYYNHNSGDEEWIEFPDKNIHFDTNLRKWIGLSLYEE